MRKKKRIDGGSLDTIYTFLEYMNFLGTKYIRIEIYMRSYIRNGCKIDLRIRVLARHKQWDFSGVRRH
jgi:hypothetical protein